MYSYFCSNGCYNDFANKYIQQVIAIAPRTEPLETPIDRVEKVKHTNNGYHFMDRNKDNDLERCDNFIHGPCIMVHGTRQNNRKEHMKTQTKQDERTEERKNRFTGESIMLTPAEAIKHDRIFLNELAATLEDKQAGFDGFSKLWDKVRADINWFRQHNAKAYMVLLD
jgi:hypothetical protein